MTQRGALVAALVSALLAAPLAAAAQPAKRIARLAMRHHDRHGSITLTSGAIVVRQPDYDRVFVPASDPVDIELRRIDDGQKIPVAA